MAVRKPCASCPWRVDQDATVIPGFSMAKAEALVNTCETSERGGVEFGAPQFACHQSNDGEEVVCAGWLATQGAAHPNVRLGVLIGRTPVEALRPGEDWPELHESFEEVIEKLRATCPEEAYDL